MTAITARGEYAGKSARAQSCGHAGSAGAFFRMIPAILDTRPL
jgi:hypothetical protein